MLSSLIRKGRWVGAAVLLGLLAVPAEALGIRYASPTGSSAANCQTPATACDPTTAIQGTGVNTPSNGEEVVILTGNYPTQTTELNQGAANLDIHGESGQPRPVINLSGIARWALSSGTLSYLHFKVSGGSGEAVNSDGGTIDRVFMESSGIGASIPVCECASGLVRNSVFVTNNPGQPALGAEINGASRTGTYRNVTAYSSLAGSPAIAIQQIGSSGTLDFTIDNAIAVNTAGGAEVEADGPNATIRFSRSNYRNVSTPQGGVIQHAAGDVQQTALPLFANPGAGDFGELSGSPTIDAGATDPLNGPLDFAGSPRTVGGCTDIGAYEFTGATPPCLAPPGLALLGRKVRVNRKGRGTLQASCTSAPPEQCTVQGTLSSGKTKRGHQAKASQVGTLSGTIAGGATGTLTVTLTKAGRKSLALRGKLRPTVAATITGKSGVSGALSAKLKLIPKRKR